MTEKVNLEKQLTKIISESLGVEKKKISLDSDFYSDLNASKLELADLILACQQKLNINLVEEAINEIRTVADLLKLFEESSDEI